MNEIVLTIRLEPQTGKLLVDGPLENEMLFDWLLKKAGEQAAAWRQQQQQQQGIKVPAPGFDVERAARRVGLAGGNGRA